MDWKEITIENPVRESGVTVIPVAKIFKSKSDRKDFPYLFIKKEPAAIIVRYEGVSRIFNENWEEVSSEDFIKHFPGDARQLESLIGFNRV